MPTPNTGPSRASADKPARGAGRPNTLGLSRRELEVLLDEIDAENADDRNSVKRRFVRRPFRHATIPMRVTFIGGAVSTFPVACRNISRSGMCVLHSAFVHPGSPCTITLPARNAPITITGKVVRCQHRRAMIHELGISFDKPINLASVVPTDLFSDWFSLESVEPAELTCRLLYIDSSPLDRQFFRYYLRETGISLIVADDALAGLDLAQQHFDIIVADDNLHDVDGVTLIQQLRDKGVHTPVILITADSSPAVRRRFADSSAQAFLQKPLEPSLLLRAIAEFTTSYPAAKRRSAESTAADAAPAQALVIEFLNDAEQTADALEHALTAHDADALRRLCINLKGSAPAVGFRSLADMASELLLRLPSAHTPEDLATEIHSLAIACRTAKRRKAS